MYMILQLHNDKYLDDVILALAEAGIADTIVLSEKAWDKKCSMIFPCLSAFRILPRCVQDMET
jgi:hypothetical protein